jgi:hypothetical protein
MAPTKKSSSKPAGKFKVQAGPGSKMHKFAGVTEQKPGITSVTPGSGKGAAFPKGGPSGKMHGFSPVKGQKSGRSSQS